MEDVQQLALSTLFAELNGTNVTNEDGVVAEREDVVSSASVLSKVVVAATGADLVIGFGDVTVELPAAFLEAFAEPLWAISAGLITENSSFPFFADAITADNSDGYRLAEPLVSLKVYRKASHSEAVEVFQLPTPILLTLPYEPWTPPENQRSLSNARCVFWDEELQGWSTEGVSLVAMNSSSITCATSHLSLFAVMLLALVCSNAAAIFSAEGLRSLSAADWPTRLPAIATWLTLVLGIFLLALAAVLDRRHRHLREELLHSWESKQEAAHTKMTSVELPKEKLTPQAKTARKFLLQHLHSKILLAEMGVDLAFLKQLYVVGGYTALHERAHKVLESFYKSSPWQRVVVSFRAFSSWMDFSYPVMRSSSLERCAAQQASLWSSLGFVAVFYSTTAMTFELPTECEVFERGVLEMVLRGAVVSVLATAIGFLPLLAVLTLEEKLLATRLHLAARLVFWMFVSCYVAVSVLVISIFISTVSTSDGVDFLISAVTGIVRTLCLSPSLMVCVFVPLVSCTSKDPSLPFAPPHETTYALCLDNIAIPSALQGDVRLSCQVPGHRRASTTVKVLETDGGQCVEGIGLTGLTEHHMIVIGIYVNSKFRGSGAVLLRDLMDGASNRELSLQRHGKGVDLSVHLTAQPPMETSQELPFPTMGEESMPSNEVNEVNEVVEVVEVAIGEGGPVDPVLCASFLQDGMEDYGMAESSL